ncbi:hypothetical protein EGJ83_26705, partial [Pseudomonas aeruginosa]
MQCSREPVRPGLRARDAGGRPAPPPRGGGGGPAPPPPRPPPPPGAGGRKRAPVAHADVGLGI